ncbi:MAG TPA: VacJ family lipoprotein [Rariglobus sp.]|nr:VacJ family lipoprotein [Rariglobus sp.]
MHPSKILLWIALGLFLSSLARAQQNQPPDAASMALADDDEYAVVKVYDPLEPFNRAMFKFNNGVYDYVFRPVSKGYVKVMPTPARHGLSNFFANLRFPIRFVSDVLQFKFKRAGLETKKFYVNTIAGLGGFIRISDDVPSLANLPHEDLGQTFGVWGIHKGPYLVLPVLGPATTRDAVGLVGDYFLNPLHWNQLQYVDGHRWWWDTAIQTTDTVNSLPDLLKLYDEEKQAALDPYIAVRSAYTQYRDAAVKQ